MISLFGIPVYVTPFDMVRQTIELSDSVNVSDSFRADMNAWLLEQFGEEHYMLMTSVNGSRVLLADLVTHSALKQEVESE